MLVSFVPGRVRLRFKELKESAVAENTRQKIQQTSGVTKVEINQLTGSLLIEYDEKILPTDKLLELGKQELANLKITYVP